MAGEGLERKGGDKPLRVRRHYNVNSTPSLDEQTGQIHRPMRGNRPRHSQHNDFASHFSLAHITLNAAK